MSNAVYQGNAQIVEQQPVQDSEDTQSLFHQFKKQMGQENKRQTFMKLHKMDSGTTQEDTRMNVIMTPIVASGVDKRNSELEMSKGDMSTSSHYHRFKRNSLGYQSQRPQIYGNR